VNLKSVEPVTRRRGAALEDALLDAVWAELREVGYAGLTFEGVAHRACTSRTVLYRRWSTRAQLVAAILGADVPEPAELADTGTLRGDLLDLLVRLQGKFARLPADAVRGLMFELLQDPETAALRDQIDQPQFADLVLVLLQRAADRGEIPSALVHPRVASLPKDLLRNELVTGGAGRVPEAVIAEILDEVFLPLVRG
jgi:AcrR family transcriptional regulator